MHVVSDTDLEIIAEHVIKKTAPTGWRATGASLMPILGIVWSILTIVVVPWAIWVTSSIFALRPEERRYTRSEAAIEHAELQRNISKERDLGFRTIEAKLDAQKKVLEEIRLTLARRGLE